MSTGIAAPTPHAATARPAVVAPPAKSAPPLYGERSFTLANGLQVVVIENRRAPTVTHWVWYKVGAADEFRGQSGSAHFLEHLMFRGTKTQKPKEFSELVARVGGEENAFTSWDYTAFHQTVGVDQLELVMRLEADRMHNLVITEDQLKPERSVVLEEWRMRTGNQPGSLLDEQVEAALYLNSPYRIPVLGWKNEIEQLGVAVEKHFYDTWYSPGNAVLIIDGDVTPDRVRQLAEKYYGPVPNHPVPPRDRPQEPERSADVVVRLADSRVRQPEWSKYYQAPSYRTADDDFRSYALQVLANILGGGANSRLHRVLVLKQNLATDVAAFYEGTRYDLGRFGIAADARAGVPIEKLGEAAEAVTAELLDKGVTDDEVDRAKRRIITLQQYAGDSLTRPVEIIGRALCTGRTLAQLDAFTDRIASVTPAQVNQVAHEVLDRRPSVVGLLLSAPGSPTAPQSLGPPPGDIR